MDTSATQLLHLRLREHLRREGRQTLKKTRRSTLRVCLQNDREASLNNMAASQDLNEQGGNQQTCHHVPISLQVGNTKGPHRTTMPVQRSASFSQGTVWSVQINTQTARLRNLCLVWADQVGTGTHRGARPVPIMLRTLDRGEPGPVQGRWHQVTSLRATHRWKSNTSAESASWLSLPSLPPEVSERAGNKSWLKQKLPCGNGCKKKPIHHDTLLPGHRLQTGTHENTVVKPPLL